METGIVPKDSLSSSDTGTDEPSTLYQQLQAAHDIQIKKLNQHIEQLQEDNFSLLTQVTHLLETVCFKTFSTNQEVKRKVKSVHCCCDIIENVTLFIVIRCNREESRVSC